MPLADLIDPAARPEKIAGGFKFTEGPVFNRRGYLLFSDIPNNRILKWERGRESVLRENSNGANGLTFDHQGRLLACETGRVTRTEKDGRITVLASSGLERPNDVVYAIDGSIYFSDLPRSRVYHITRQGDVRVAAQDAVAPNGVALSPNQQKLYVADTKQRVLRVYDIAAGGALGGSREFAACRADGLKTDERGNVWAASEGGLWIYDSSGAKLGVVETPEPPSNCNWGPGFRGLY
ncbi:MAG: SMP-30/gluconolactonase/LRE family protein, partial [Bryobacteraceae bacterium]